MPFMEKRSAKTQFAFFWMTLVDEPFFALFTLMLFILKKDLGASTFQLSFFAAMKPLVSLFSFYWSSSLENHKHKLLSNFIYAWVLGRIPFLFVFYIHSAWFLIFCGIWFQLFYRAGIPSQIELANINIPKKPLQKLFSNMYLLRFIESIFLGLFLGKVLDLHSNMWQYCFSLFALLSLTSVLIQKNIPFSSAVSKNPEKNEWKNPIIGPWKDCAKLIQKRPDFAHFQWSFMLGGIGLMIITPAIAIYHVEILHLNHEEISIARYIWMGMGVLASSYIWRKVFAYLPLKATTGIILIGFALYPLFLLAANYHLLFLNFAFLFYGIAQAGSNLVWNLSATVFAKEENSSKFSTTNILMVGIRGVFAPAIGGFLCVVLPLSYVLIIGCVISLVGASYSLLLKPVLSKEERAYKAMGQ